MPLGTSGGRRGQRESIEHEGMLWGTRQHRRAQGDAVGHKRTQVDAIGHEGGLLGESQCHWARVVAVGGEESPLSTKGRCGAQENAVGHKGTQVDAMGHKGTP